MYVTFNEETNIDGDSRPNIDSVQFQSSGITNSIFQTPSDQRNDVESKLFGDALMTFFLITVEIKSEQK